MPTQLVELSFLASPYFLSCAQIRGHHELRGVEILFNDRRFVLGVGTEERHPPVVNGNDTGFIAFWCISSYKTGHEYVVWNDNEISSYSEEWFLKIFLFFLRIDFLALRLPVLLQRLAVPPFVGQFTDNPKLKTIWCALLANSHRSKNTVSLSWQLLP